MLNGKPISSTLTRGLIYDGLLDQVPSLLGKFYGFNVVTVHGSNRGKSMNYPTANFIPLSKYQMIPEGGVYFSRVFIDGEHYFGMTNIGYRPTFNEKKFVMEVHILSDKFSDLYDESFYIEFLHKIRNEKKFESKDYLIKQIEDDKEVCIKLIDSFKEKYEV
jgi:riboflavin kinase/FMN adenylyltransferase